MSESTRTAVYISELSMTESLLEDLGTESLASITIPTSVTEIAFSAFRGCTQLKEVKYLGTKAQWRNITKDSFWHVNVPAKKVVCKDGKPDFD